MAFAGFKKQINKANQYVTEKMGGAEGTKLDLDFMEMERKTDVTVELVEELQIKTKEFLQPNPTARAKMAAVKGISKLSGQAKSNTYPQPEGLLADCMLTYGKKLGEESSVFAQALVEFGEALRQMADVKYSLDDNIKQNFLEPLHHMQMKDLKEVMHHRKKLQGRRLDFDCKRRRQAKDDEIRSSEEKFAESLHLAQMGMFNLLENDTEQVSQLVTFAEALYEFHSQCADILRGLQETLQEKREEAEARPKPEFVPKTLLDLNLDGTGNDTESSGTPAHHRAAGASPLPSPMRSPAKSMATTPSRQQMQPYCQALYDFDPQNPGELGFKEHEIITLLSRVDDNWFEGSLNGRTGYFPQSYVQVVVPLPNGN
ncbi:endophilin-A [Stomoxys calcitrans]|uniref:Endophilin-A n=1 Tax=Stomoxys calcitrans TaxID=35570 RepID=A0A1I8PWN1_STOCA|nr:endophilin-A [Stomoxys calcitrans]XP_059218111.1 endophilin-A [Stomoxys calcitrans]XP_059218112.1 endophilin-A [Stomoxys calcitrans]XP_059218113.1 endophilin-A [Stomoxys calcitrans]